MVWELFIIAIIVAISVAGVLVYLIAYRLPLKEEEIRARERSIAKYDNSLRELKELAIKQSKNPNKLTGNFNAGIKELKKMGKKVKKLNKKK